MSSATYRVPGDGIPVVIKAPLPSTRSRKRAARVVLHAVFGVLGFVALGLLIQKVGAARLLEILGQSAGILPLLIALDVGRIAAEALGTSLLARPHARVPALALARSHFVAHAVGSIVPAGRTAGEAVKATMLCRWTGLPRAAAIAATNQALALLSGAVIALVCAAVAYAWHGSRAFIGALLFYALTAFGGFSLVQLGCRRPEILGFLGRRFARLDAATASFQGSMAGIPVVPAGTLLLMIGARAILALEYGVLISAVGGAFGFGPALLGNGVSLLGGAVGDLVPGQLGATDAAFALGAPMLGLSVASAVSVSILAHCLQLFWGLVGAVGSIFFRAQRKGEPRGSDGAVEAASQV